MADIKRPPSSFLATFVLALIGGGAIGARAEPKCLDLFKSEEQLHSDDRGVEIEALTQALRGRLLLNHDAFLFEPVEDYAYIWDELKNEFPALRDASHELDRVVREHVKHSDDLERRIVREVGNLLQGGQKSVRQDQAALLALEELGMLRRYSDSLEHAGDEAGEDAAKKAADEAKKEKKPPKKKPPEPPKQKQPPEFPDAQNAYKAKIKDFPDGGEGGAPEKVSIASVNEPGVVYFKTQTYGMVDARTAQWTSVPISVRPDASVPKDFSEFRKLTLKPHGKKGQTLPVILPEGYVPIVKSEGASRVWRTEDGNYLFNTDKDDYVVTLVPERAVAKPLTPLEMQVYTQKSGIATKEWPEKIQLAISKIHAMKAAGQIASREEIAMIVQEVLKRQFLYAMDEVTADGAVAMAHNGAFQCDGAATIMTSILREEFDIPTRICGGFQGSRHGADAGSSHVVVPGVGHAWVEVADERGEWKTFDPTPTKKTRPEKKPEGSESGEWKPNTKEDENSEDPSGDSQGQEADGKPSDKKSDKAADENLKKIIDEFKEKKAAEAKAEAAKKGDAGEGKGEGKGGGTGKEGKEGKDKDGKNKTESPTPKVHLPPSSLDEVMKTLDEGNPLLRDFAHEVAGWALNPKLSTAEKIERIERARGNILASGGAVIASIDALAKIFGEAKTVFVDRRPAFAKWANSIAAKAESVPLSKTADEMNALKIQLEFSLRLAKGDDYREMAVLLDRVNRARAGLASVRHPDSEKIQVARELFQNLPGSVSKKVLKDKFAITGDLGDDLGTLSLSDGISGGKLDDFRMMSILGPHTSFVTDPIYRPASGTAKTWERAYRRQPGRPEILMTKDYRDQDKWINFAPHLSEDEAYNRGMMGVVGQRKTIKVPKGVQGIDPEEATIILYDTSGSMSNDAEFQSAYIGAIVDRALSDVSATGRIRKRVYLCGFGDNVHSQIEVTSREQAIQVLKDLKNKTRNTNSGTNIQSALIDGGAALIKEANRTGDRALSRANVILLSDGGSAVDAARVNAAFAEAKGKDTQIMMAFVAIRETNPTLIELTEHSKKLGADKASYIYWAPEDMQKVTSAAHSPPKAANDFWTKASFGELGREARTSVLDLAKPLPSGTGAIEELKSLKKVERKLEVSRRGIRSLPDRTIVLKVEALRVALDAVSTLIDPALRSPFLDAVLRKNENLLVDIGRDYSEEEIGVITHLVRWARP